MGTQSRFPCDDVPRDGAAFVRSHADTRAPRRQRRRGRVVTLLVCVFIFLACAAVVVDVAGLSLSGAGSGLDLSRDRDHVRCVGPSGDGVCLAADGRPLTAGAGPLSGCPQLRSGDAGDCVRRLQGALRDAGFPALPVTGVFAVQTQTAVKAIQRAASPPIPDTGIVGARTQAALEKATHRAGASGIRPSGASGSDIVALAQRVMAGRMGGWTAGPVPYVWGGGHGARPGPSTGTCDGYESSIPCAADVTTGIDCSGFTRWVYSVAYGTDILGPGDADSQLARATLVDDPQPGDLVFFGETGDAHHVAIYLGGDRVIHAPDTGHNVEVGDLSDLERPLGFARIKR